MSEQATEYTHSAVIQVTHKNWWDKEPTIERVLIRGNSLDELAATYFKDFDNRYKYANSVRLEILNDELKEHYKTWIQDVNNYANNGGDMW
jgi:hypothetical protein